MLLVLTWWPSKALLTLWKAVCILLVQVGNTRSASLLAGPKKMTANRLGIKIALALKSTIPRFPQQEESHIPTPEREGKEPKEKVAIGMS